MALVAPAVAPVQAPFGAAVAQAQDASVTPTKTGYTADTAIDADGIANGDITEWQQIESLTPHVSGYGVYADRMFSSTNGGGNTAVPDGTVVYMQWIDTDGSVSPYFKVQTHNGFSNAENGAYYFHGERLNLTDERGILHEFFQWFCWCKPEQPEPG